MPNSFDVCMMETLIPALTKFLGKSSAVKNTKSSSTMASQSFIQGHKMDWTDDPELHKHFKEWREETELLVDTALAHTKDKTTKMKYVTLWAGSKDISTHSLRPSEDQS